MLTSALWNCQSRVIKHQHQNTNLRQMLQSAYSVIHVNNINTQTTCKSRFSTNFNPYKRNLMLSWKVAVKWIKSNYSYALHMLVSYQALPSAYVYVQLAAFQALCSYGPWKLALKRSYSICATSILSQYHHHKPPTQGHMWHSDIY